MAAACATRDKRQSRAVRPALHPNDLDRKRIEKALARRARYRYVTPRVCFDERGYRVTSPCCSRNIDKDGGEIDIALIQFVPRGQAWRLFSRDHDCKEWVPYGDFPSLTALLEPLLTDRERRFWQ